MVSVFIISSVRFRTRSFASEATAVASIVAADVSLLLVVVSGVSVNTIDAVVIIIVVCASRHTVLVSFLPTAKDKLAFLDLQLDA
jgi:hypothetical protein